MREDRYCNNGRVFCQKEKENCFGVWVEGRRFNWEGGTGYDEKLKENSTRREERKNEFLTNTHFVLKLKLR